jgi:hypothetical protein
VAIETALTACQSSPSTCAATIDKLNLTLEEMGVQAEIVGPNGKVTIVLSTPSEILADRDPSNRPSASETLSNYRAGEERFNYIPGSNTESISVVSSLISPFAAPAAPGPWGRCGISREARDDIYRQLSVRGETHIALRWRLEP